MTRVISLYAMVPKASFDGTALTEATLPYSEIVQRIKEAIEPLRDDIGSALDFIYMELGHPLMRPEAGYVVFVSFPFSCLFVQLIF